MLAAEGLEGSRRVHVGDGDDGLEAIGGGAGSEEVFEVGPAVGDGLEVGHVGHGAAGGEVGEDDGLVGPGEHVGGLGHEVDAAEDEGLGVGAGAGGLGELEGVADEVRVLGDLVALVEVAEDDDAVAESVLGGADAEVEFGRGRGTVLLGEDALVGGEGGDGVKLGGAGAVAGLGIEEPGGFREAGVTGGPGGGMGNAAEDFVDGDVDG